MQAGSGPLRVLIVGSSGAGKSVLGQEVAARLGSVYIDLDAWRRRNGERVPPSALSTRAGAVAAQSAWVCEGIFITWTEPLMAAADSIVWLRPSTLVSFGRVWRRYLTDGERRQRHGLVATLRLSWTVLRPSSLTAVLSSEANLNPSNRAFAEVLAPYEDKVVVVRSNRDRALLLARLGRS